MGHIDVTLKKLLSGGAPEFLQQIGFPRKIHFLPGEVYEDTELRVDVLARSVTGEGPFLHAEMQANNHPEMLIRMLRYRGGIAKRLVDEGRHVIAAGAPMPEIDQICVYVGRQDMSMQPSFESLGDRLSFRLVDARNLRADKQLGSASINDVVLSVICRDGSTPQVVERILNRIAVLEPSARSDAFVRLAMLANLRGVRDRVLARRGEMGFSVDVSDVPLFEDAFKRDRTSTTRKAFAAMIINALESRFGDEAVPHGIRDTLEDLTEDALLRMNQRVAGSKSVEEVLGNHMPASSRTFR
ncbi:hypothetical protein ACXR8U_11140 [Methylobacterium radiotolerans]|uniref:hypothetical protein n=1 Tax=Methylobacterium TaxID=407 RepID=UPI0005E9A404|nr:MULTISPECIES: hypothetical protein [Methylobacterium]MBN6820621.1 hypothetical protein [Methylobacterium organophilum]OXE41468.1 hypothetical protein CCS92_13450 [Methylobacterium radiotolerans]GAN48008.1 hypothetical protein ME121_2021 [Methylobacterium sp. ME121]